MSDLRELYQEVILDHSRKPRNFHALENADRKVEGFNPLCGDHFTIYLRLDGDIIRDISFDGSGCAISKASASMMTTSLKGKTIAQARELFGKFHAMLSRDATKPFEDTNLGKLSAFSGVCEFPVRVKCATLAWHTMHSGLDGECKTVSTE